MDYVCSSFKSDGCTDNCSAFSTLALSVAAFQSISLPPSLFLFFRFLALWTSRCLFRMHAVTFIKCTIDITYFRSKIVRYSQWSSFCIVKLTHMLLRLRYIEKSIGMRWFPSYSHTLVRKYSNTLVTTLNYTPINFTMIFQSELLARKLARKEQ